MDPFHADVSWPLTLMEVADAAVSQLQGIAQVSWQQRPGAFELLG